MHLRRSDLKEGLRKWRTAMALMLALCGAARAAQPVLSQNSRQTLPGHVPEVVKNLQPVNRLPGSKHMNLAIGLPLRNQEELTNLLQQIYDPASPNFRRYLTPEQFTQMFG